MENENELMKIYYEKKNDFLRLNSELRCDRAELFCH